LTIEPTLDSFQYRAVLVTIALFAAGICLGIAGACAWAWGVRSGQFRDMEKTKEQLFWPEIAPDDGGRDGE
jgi:cbb3-type cytochrome oxidase maturation protein